MNKVNRIVYDNGLTLVHQELDIAPLAALAVWVKVGSAAEKPDEFGLAHMCEHMVFKGTAKRSYADIFKEILEQ